MNGNGTFVADEVLAKHDEKYMPPEVAKSLKRRHGEAREDALSAAPGAGGEAQGQPNAGAEGSTGQSSPSTTGVQRPAPSVSPQGDDAAPSRGAAPEGVTASAPSGAAVAGATAGASASTHVANRASAGVPTQVANAGVQ
jgi:hypothetical protein